MSAILDFVRNEAFPKVDSGGVLCVFLCSPTESNYVEKNLLRFISIKYLGIFHFKMQIINFLGLIIWPWRCLWRQLTSYEYEQMESL